MAALLKRARPPRPASHRVRARSVLGRPLTRGKENGSCPSAFKHLFNVFRPPLIQGLAIVGKVLLNVFWYWGPINTRTSPGNPFKVIPKASWGSESRGSLIQDVKFLFFWGPIVRGDRD